MTEPYEAREIQEGDWVMQSGEPYVYYGEKLLATGELVTWFKDIIEEWAERVRLECETTQGFHTLQTEAARLKAQEEVYLDMVENGQEELAAVRKKNRALVDEATRELEVADILTAAKDEVVSLKRSNAALVEDLRKANGRLATTELGPFLREVKPPRLCDKCGAPSPPTVLYGSVDDDGKPLDLCDGCMEGMPDRPKEEKGATS